MHSYTHATSHKLVNLFDRHTITIATRQSPLALWQANFVKDLLVKAYPHLHVDLLTMRTQGDNILDTPLAKIGGKGLFVKELESALLDGRADIAVHSLKDVPMVLPDGLMLGAILARHNPTDAFVSNEFLHLTDLPINAHVGTSSLRRACQLLNIRPDLSIGSLRGNVGTRLGKLDRGDYQAIILASSGLHRLDLSYRIRYELPCELSLPAVGQGALAIECADDDVITHLISCLHCTKTALCVSAERAMNAVLNGGCQVPIAGFAVLRDRSLCLQGRVGTPDGKVLLKATSSVVLDDATENQVTQAYNLGVRVADELLAQGAGEILAELLG